MRGVAMMTMLNTSSTNHHGKYSQCPAFDIKQSPAGRSPEDHQVHAHAYLCLNKAHTCFMLPCFLYLFLYALVWMCVPKYIHRRFKSSMVFGLKCLLQSN